MALSSWNGVYSHIEQRFMRQRRYKLFFLLKVFCQHADEFGFSYPGEQLIKDLTGLGTTAVLNEALEFLTDGEYLKIWDTWNQRRKTYDRDYQVSPYVLYIREELMPYTVHVWNTGERDFGFENAIVIKRKVQPESEPESEPESVNQNQYPSPPPRPESREATDSARDYTNQRQRRKPTAGKARSTEKETAHAGPPPATGKPDLRKFRSALPRLADEDAAQDLKLVFRFKIAQARHLVATYGQELVATAAAATKEAMDAGTATNPPGLLTSMLKKGMVNADDGPLFNRKKSIADETARWDALTND